MNDGGQAFPEINTAEYERGENQNHTLARFSGPPGMSLRDWFAGMALQGLATGLDWTPGRLLHGNDELASDAYDIADAMLAEKEKRK